MDSSGAVESVVHSVGPFQVVRRELANDHKHDVFEVRAVGGQVARPLGTLDDAVQFAESSALLAKVVADSLEPRFAGVDSRLAVRSAQAESLVDGINSVVSAVGSYQDAVAEWVTLQGRFYKCAAAVVLLQSFIDVVIVARLLHIFG